MKVEMKKLLVHIFSRPIVASLFFIAALAFGTDAFCSSPDFSHEDLHYKVMYKWGLINKQAGRATLSIRVSGDQYVARLIAHSEPWADKFYCVRDTLNGVMERDGLRPLFYEKIAHEGAEDKHDTVKFIYEGNKVTGHTTRKVVKKGTLKRDDSNVMEAVGLTVDMLSSFYVMRSLPFDTWSPGHRETLTIFSGKTKETLTFQYHGVERAQVGDKFYQCHHITFIFTGDGGKKTSDDMDAWITTSPARVPVLLEGKLPVGKVKCELIN